MLVQAFQILILKVVKLGASPLHLYLEDLETWTIW